MKQIISGKRYDTETAMEIASNKYWDGQNWDRCGRSQTLFKTDRGNYFIYYETRWQGERDNIEAITQEEAEEKYEELPEHAVEYEQAFEKDPVEA